MRRVFWAIEISEAVRSVVRSIKEQVTDPNLRWTPVEKLHVTLKYLGDTDFDPDALIAAALPHCGSGDPLALNLGEVGSFGSPPRVIWLGLKGPGHTALCTLAENLDLASSKLGFERERRPYTPHLTLARVRRGARTDSPEGVVVTPTAFRVDRLLLLESRPGKAYRSLAELDL